MMRKKNVPGMGRGSVHGVWRRATALLLALSLCLPMVSTTAWAATDTETVASQEDAAVTEMAEETEAEPESETETEIVQAEEVVWLNPFLEEALSETDLTASSEDETSEADAYADSEEAAVEELRAGLKARQETIVVGYTADSYEETAAESIAETALAHTGEAAEGDSLRLQLGGWRAAASYYTEDEICYITLTYTVTYLTTAAQEEEADAAVAEIAEELALSEGSAYEKISAIYGYLCAQVTCVDREKATELLQYTAYAALTEGTATDVGCAALTFRLALAAGLDARVIAGTWDDGSGAEPVNHVWNLIGLDGGVYYNVDTALACREEAEESSAYFLKCDAAFADHVRSDAYDTEEFRDAYPMAEEDYVTEEETAAAESTEEESSAASEGEEENSADAGEANNEDASADSENTDSSEETVAAAESAQSGGLLSAVQDSESDGEAGISVASEGDADTGEEADAAVSAASTDASDFTYSVLNGTYCSITGYSGTETAITIPTQINGYIVQEIEASAFKNNTTIVSVTISSTVELIDSSAFYGCTSLESVTVGDSVTSIESNAFYGCTSLVSADLGSSVTEIGSKAFYGCSSLTEVSLSETLTTIGNNAFSGCTSLTTLELPDSVTTLGYYVFDGCTGLTSINYPAGLSSCATTGSYYGPFAGSYIQKVTVPEGASSIAAYTFGRCTTLTGIEIPGSVNTIGNRAFYGCTGLASVTLAAGLTSIGSNAFYGCTGLTALELPETLTSLGSYAFSGCSGLSSLSVPEGVASLPSNVFEKCTGLTSVTLPAGLTSIGNYAFTGCTGLTTLELPDSVTTLGYYIFNDCTSLKEINYPTGLSSCETTGSYYGPFAGSSIQTVTVPEGVTSITSYTFGQCTSLEEIMLPASVGTIDTRAFYNCTGLTSVTFSEGLTSIGSYAFYGCASLKELALPETLETLGSYAFAGSSGLGSLSVPEKVTSLPNNVCENCTGLTTVSLPETLTSIGNYAFSGCTGLTTLELPDNVTTLGYYVFNGCTNLTSVNYPKSLSSCTTTGSYYGPFAGASIETVTIPDGVTAIPSCTFSQCTSLKTIVLPDSVTTIGERAFYGCTGLESVTLPAELTEIGSHIFDGCSSLSDIELPSTLTSIGNYAFYGCTGLSELTTPESLTSIGSYAYANCIMLRRVTFNEKLTSIGSYAFSGCTGLVSLVLNDGLETISASAFANCTNLTAVTVPDSVTSIGSNVFSNCSKLTIYCNSGSTAYSTAMSAGYTCYQLDEHEHDYEVTLETSATCTRAGSQILTCSICGYNYIEVLEALGHDYADTVTDPTCTKKGYTTHVCSRCGDTYTDSYVAATGHTYGDWTVTTEATLLAEGVQTRTCSVCGEEETEAIAKLSVDYGENSDYGLANFTIVDATTLKAIPNACLFISTDDDGEATLVADENGKISQVLPVGKWSVSVYAEGYQPRTLKVTIKAGEQDIATIGISESQLVDATVTTTEMTYEEMVEAGINVDASSNHQYYKYSVTITFTATLDVMSLITYTDEEGTVVATSSTSSTASSRTYYALSHDGADVEAEAVKLIYSSEHGTYILDSDVTESSVWTPTGNEAMTLSNGGYYAEGYGIPSELHMNSSLTFSDSGWEYSDGVLSMDTGSYVHYLTYCEGTFCTVSSADDAATMQLFVQETVDWFDDETVVWVPAEELTAGTEYLIVQKSSVSTNNRYALSHAAEKPDAEKVRVYGDDTYGNYISDSSSLDSAVWTMSGSDSALTFCNNEYYPQVDTELATLYFDNVLEALDWNYDGGYLYTTIGEETYYLRYNNGYTVTNDRRYAGPVTLYEKTAVTDDLNAEKIIYKAVDGYEDGKEYIIVGSSRAPASSSGGGSIYYAGGGDDTNSVSGTLSDGTTVTVYPVSEKFYLIIYGECSWLKEMYDVEMLIVNNSLTDTLEDCTAELLLPDGLSLAEMNDGEQSSVQTVDYIEEGGSESLHWYVRGDEEGTYNVTATLAGMMMPHEEEFYYEFEANSPIKVYAGSAMQMTFHIPEAAYNGMDYIVTIELENVSNKVIYGIRHAITGWEAGKITYYSDGTEETTVYADEGYLGSISTDEFYPGDKIVIELSLPILFESSLIESLEEAVDGFESLYNSYKALKASYDALSAITSFCKGASKSLDSVIKSSSSSMDSTKAKATSDLLEAVNKLLSKYEEGDSEALKYVTKIQGTDLYETLEKLASETDCTAFLAASDAATIAALAVKFGSALGEDEDESDGSSGRGDSEESGSSESEDSSDDDFNVFDSLRTLLTMIPMRYVVDNVIVSTLEGSTTEIPYTVELTPVESSFFGVNNLGKYLYNLTIAGMGKISAPLPYDIIGDFDDLTGYEDAVAYVKQTESAMEAYTVSGNADATFRAWIERSSSASGISLASESDDNAFTLETANETAEYDENGVLTFTGSAVLDVTANTTEGGTLYVEDVASGCVKSFVIDVVEEHTCSSDTWVTVLSPTDEYDGYRAKYCDTCGDVIGVEIITACEEHSYGDAVVTQEATCAQAGVQYRVCETCGGIQYEYLDPTGHTVETWTIETEATCTEEGSQTGTCTVCGETVTETIEATGHVYEESYQSDASGHWQVCTVCEEDSEVEAHTYENGVCTVCGYYEIAEGNLAAGSCGGNLTWVLSEDGVLTVSGTGEMTSWTEESLAPWADYQAQITSVVIASGVTSIGDYAFYGCTNLTEISVATSVTTVGASAFEGCTSLMSVAISTAVTSVGERAYGYAVDETEPMEDFVIHGSTGSAAETYANSNNISFEDPDACVYNAPVFTWDGTTSCTATFVCGVCGESENVTCTVSSETTEATCTADGVTIYTAICTFEDETYTDTQKVIIPATGHSYGEPTFVWAEDYSSCAATFTCSAGDDTQTVDTTVTSETTEATCTEDGKIVYTATCTFESETYTDTQTVTLTATGHDYVAVVTEPTCTKDGYTTYTCSKCGDTYTADETEATGHSYGEPTFTWAEDHSSCTATFTCSKEDDTQTVTCTVTSETTEATCTEDGKIVYTATCTFEDKAYTDTQTVTLPATGHNYGEPIFTWAADHSSCTATFTCSAEDDTQTLDAAVTNETTAATCTENGKIEYTATVTFAETEYTDMKTEAIPATGHSYGEPTFTWSADYSSCTATFTCSAGDDTQTVDAEVTSKTTAATCTVDGKTVYTATVTFAGTEYTDTKTDVIPATGHSYTSSVTEPTCTVGGYTTYTCSKCGDTYTDDETAATGHSYSYKDNGDGTHTATCSKDGASYTASHTYVNGVCSVCGVKEVISLSACTVTLSATSYTYNGAAKTPTVTVKYGSTTLTKGTDYTVTYSNNTNAGTATVAVTGTGNYTGTVTKTFTISKASQTVTASVGSSTIYVKKTTTITASGVGTITYTSGDTSIATVSSSGVVTGKAPGKVTITVKAAGDSNRNSATKKVTVTVKLATPTISSLTNTTKGVQIKWGKVSGAKGYYIYRKTSSGSYKKVKTIKSGSTVSYTDTAVKSKNGTTYTYAVKAYSGSSTSSYKGVKIVRLTTPSLSSVKNSSSKKLSVKWTKVSKVTGYQLQYSTSKSFSGSKTVTVSGTSKTISGLTKGKTYYVRLRTYKKVSGLNYYSAWSSTKKVKITK